MRLRYGLNPERRPAAAEPVRAGDQPLELIHGTPSYVNLLDALTAWSLVREAAEAFGRPAATSYKHVSPAGAALDGPVDDAMVETFRLGELSLDSAVARAYVRARDADPKSAFGDFVAVSHPVDVELATVLRKLVSDGIVAPAFDPEALDILRRKKKGGYLVVRMDPAYQPPEHEARELFGVSLVQPTDHTPPDRAPFVGLPDAVADDLLLGMIVAKYTQSNSVAYTHAGMAIGIGAGQQSRVDCTRIAGEKADLWWSRRGVAPHDVALVSDGMFPFRDNVDEAARHGVTWIAEPGGSIRTPDVAAACAEHGIGHVQTGQRLFRH